jgi:hypothetical protein
MIARRPNSKEEEMKKPWLHRPSAGVVLGTLALVVAVAGNTSAFSKTTVIVRKGQIGKAAVTAKTLAPGAVHPKALAKGAVTAGALKVGAVGVTALAPDAVTSAAIAPGSVYGGALGEVTMHSAPIKDEDADPHNGEWTLSASVPVLCAPGERLLSGGVVIPNPGNNQVNVVTSQPFVNASANGWVGRISSDFGGLAQAEVQALCLK